MKTNIFRLSRWCKYFIFENMVAFFHSLTMAVIFIPVEKARILLNAKGKTLSFVGFDQQAIRSLVDEGLLVRNNYNETKELFDLRERLINNVPLDMMYLLVTDFCNLRCRYCFEETPAVFAPRCDIAMSTDISRKAVKTFANLVEKYGGKNTKKIIHLYGGEPLLNFKAIQAAVEKAAELKKAKEMPEECEVVMVTNGVLLNEKVAEFVVNNNISVGISLDGPENFNNLYRIGKKKTNVFQKAVAAYNLLKRRGAKVGISATLTPEVVENFDEVLNFFTNDVEIRDGISWNILHYNPAVPVSKGYFQKAAHCVIKGFERFRELGIYEERMMRKLKAFINQEAMLADCGVIGNQIVVAPDGRIGVCQDFIKPRTYFDGTVMKTDYDPVRSGLFEEWKKRSPLFMEECFDCEAIAICGGGCPASVELKTGSRWNIDERICPHSKLTLQWLIQEAFSHTVKNV